MIPSRPLLLLAAAVALANAAACSRSEPPRASTPFEAPTLAFALEAPPSPAPTPVPLRLLAEPELAPSPEEIAAVEHPRVAK